MAVVVIMWCGCCTTMLTALILLSCSTAGLHFIAGVGIPVTTLPHFPGGYEGII
jgi:hypothetical protein